MSHNLTVASLMAAALFASTPALAEPPTKANILFIGNSYTAQVRAVLDTLPGGVADKGSEFAYITQGGASLSQHWEAGGALQRIRSGHWDWVVLQEQSQIPALAEHEDEFQESVDLFSAEIRAVGAVPVLYMTWGRRDGDPLNLGLLPDYFSMQKALANAYQRAAERNQALLVPVGLAWAEVWRHDGALAKGLYKADGSHPSAKGAALAASVFAKVLFNGPLDDLPGASALAEGEQATIRQAVLGVVGGDAASPGR